MSALEPWLDKRGLARHYSCSVRSIEAALSEGMPHAVIFGRVKFQVSTVDPWLRVRGHLYERGDACTVVTGSDNGAAPLARPAPDHQGASLDGTHI